MQSELIAIKERARAVGMPIEGYGAHGLDVYDNVLTGDANKQALADWLAGNPNAAEIIDALITPVDVFDDRLTSIGVEHTEQDAREAVSHDEGVGITVWRHRGEWRADGSRPGDLAFTLKSCQDVHRMAHWQGKRIDPFTGKAGRGAFDPAGFHKREARLAKATRYFGIEWALDAAGRVIRTREGMRARRLALMGTDGDRQAEVERKRQTKLAAWKRGAVQREARAAKRLQRLRSRRCAA